MRARRLSPDIKPVHVAADMRGILVDPGDAPLHLIGHDADIAAGLWRIYEIERDVIHAGLHEHLRREMIFACRPVLPRAAMRKDENRLAWFFGAEDVELL